jgi:plasmid maintenance system antidote protein VapI
LLAQIIWTWLIIHMHTNTTILLTVLLVSWVGTSTDRWMAIESNFNQLAMSSESFIKNKLK